ncbi:sensor domain-containing diguanylate cyclase [Ruminococcus albus]|uniref:GGDEF domain-containing protein, diguanylate cyclase (C-di-GMP synthetase) or its enzymatically inactive variants n=1 Tax=Ruminococcus albus TaxID=1264 RepID=A0A1I1FY64_RUMAL|nr:diguanylate cyclase [Ruminococcus albus]SFC03986.1 GGDEF domain-containing protein, diguanylate cyclase (c-di-GMP synthetase) or its enzymatically inactive variants [Ruminococcus albus]
MAKSKKKKEKKKFKISLNLVLIIQLAIMLGVSIFITNTVSSRTKQSADAHMAMTSEERAQVVLNYVELSERQLTDFSKARQVTDLLNRVYNEANGLSDDNLTADVKDMTTDELKSIAQGYTVSFGSEIPSCEGVWIGTWDTIVLTHSESPESIGMQTRKDADKLKELQDKLLAKGTGVYNAGIIQSPATGAQIVSMYKAIYNNNGKPIGLVGMGITTKGLITTLDRISGANKDMNNEKNKEKYGNSELKDANYLMLHSNSATYLFVPDEDKINTEVEVPELKELCGEYNNSNKDDEGKVEYKVNGTEYVASYIYIPKYKWLFLVSAEQKDVYALSNAMRMFLIVFGYILLALTIVFFLISKRQEKINQKLISTIAKNSQTRQSLNTAMFKDVLTNANNRVSFSMDMENADVSAQKPCYFMMFNILGFSEINTRFGNDAGDRLLVRTVETLTEVFPGKTVYRTGSDEFVVMVPSEGGQPAPDQVMNDVNTAFRQLMVPEKIENQGAIYPKYKIAVIRRSGPADTSVVSALKEMTNVRGEATYGMIDYREM